MTKNLKPRPFCGYGWEENPWVWAITFKTHFVNIDEFLKS